MRLLPLRSINDTTGHFPPSALSWSSLKSSRIKLCEETLMSNPSGWLWSYTVYWSMSLSPHISTTSHVLNGRDATNGSSAPWPGQLQFSFNQVHSGRRLRCSQSLLALMLSRALSKYRSSRNWLLRPSEIKSILEGFGTVILVVGPRA